MKEVNKTRLTFKVVKYNKQWCSLYYCDGNTIWALVATVGEERCCICMYFDILLLPFLGLLFLSFLVMFLFCFVSCLIVSQFVPSLLSHCRNACVDHFCYS